MSIEAMKQAIEAFEIAAEGGGVNFHAYAEELRQAIAEAEKQEPVAWMFQHEDTGLTDCVDVQQVEWGFENNNPRWKKIGSLYTRPQHARQKREWVGLTDRDIEDLWGEDVSIMYSGHYDAIRAIEAKLKEKNT
jgi:hypothetical protein